MIGSKLYNNYFFVCLLFIFFALISSQFSPEEQQLRKNIQKVLNGNLVQGQKWGMKYHFYRPGLYKYGPYQWLWDSSFHMISWSRLNVTNSILDLRTMLQKQNSKNWQIPQMIFWGKQSWKDKILNPLLNSDPTVTDITQMPMLSFSLNRIYEQTKNKTLLEQFLPKLIQYHQWWALHRQPDNDGLVVIIHPWQSGLDASPMYDQALKVSNPKPTLKQLYLRFQQLILSYKFQYKWNQQKIIKKKKNQPRNKLLNYFVIKQVGVNSVYTYGWKVYEKLSRQIGNNNMADYCQQQYQHFFKGVMKLFDTQKQRFVSHYMLKDKFLPTRANTVQSLFPILFPQLPSEFKTLILSALKDPKHYNSLYPIPTVSQSDPAYQPIFTIDLMWRGPSWAAPNYFILEGLKNNNQLDLYKQIGTKWVNQAIKNGIWQMWNPQTGKGYGVQNLGMSTSVIDVLHKLKQLKETQQKSEITFNN